MDDKLFWLIVIRWVCATVVVCMAFFAGCTAHVDRMISGDIQYGHISAMAANCAHSINADKQSCAIIAAQH